MYVIKRRALACGRRVWWLDWRHLIDDVTSYQRSLLVRVVAREHFRRAIASHAPPHRQLSAVGLFCNFERVWLLWRLYSIRFVSALNRCSDDSAVCWNQSINQSKWRRKTWFLNFTLSIAWLADCVFETDYFHCALIAVLTHISFVSCYRCRDARAIGSSEWRLSIEI